MIRGCKGGGKVNLILESFKKIESQGYVLDKTDKEFIRDLAFKGFTTVQILGKFSERVEKMVNEVNNSLTLIADAIKKIDVVNLYIKEVRKIITLNDIESMEQKLELASKDLVEAEKILRKKK